MIMFQWKSLVGVFLGVLGVLKSTQVVGEITCGYEESFPVLQMDIIWVLDASTSVVDEDWDRLVVFVADIVRNNFTLAPDETRMGIVTYALDTQVVFGFDDSRAVDNEEWDDFFLNTLTREIGPTDTPEALFAADDLFTPENHRPGVRRVVILATDGQPNENDGCSALGFSTDPVTCTRSVARRIKQQDNITSSDDDIVFVYLRIGDGASQTLFQGIEDYQINVVFSALQEAYDAILRASACPDDLSVTNAPTPFPTPQPTDFPTAEGQKLDCNGGRPYNQLDVLFVVDASGSIGINDWRYMKQWIADLGYNFTFGEDATRFGLITYSEEVQVEIPLTDPIATNFEDFHEKVSEMGRAFASTDTPEALILAKEYFINAGKREDSHQVVVLMTDGQPNRITGCRDMGFSTDPIECTLEAARDLKYMDIEDPDDDIDFIFYRIGNKVDEDLFEGIADYQMNVDFDSFDAQLLTQLCGCEALSSVTRAPTTSLPTKAPATKYPTNSPTVFPTAGTERPTPAVTNRPGESSRPSRSPTVFPSALPETGRPSPAPSSRPTRED